MSRLAVPRRIFAPTGYRLTVLTMLLMALPLAAAGHTRPTKDLGQLTDEAELIFEGVVTKVDYGLSDGSEAEDRPLPHTFVTYRIDQAPKGRSAAGGVITLRFLGGPAPDGRILVVSNVPNFGVGHRDMLFVRGNGQLDCPLVDCDKGRFRISNERMFTDDGTEVLLAPTGQVLYGRRQPIPEVMQKRVGPATFGLKRAVPNLEGDEKGKQQYQLAEQQLKIQGEPLTIQKFRAVVTEQISKRYRPEQLQALRPVPSVNPADRFRAQPITPKGPVTIQSLAAPQPPRTQSEQMEVDMLAKNQGNPVFKEAPPLLKGPLPGLQERPPLQVVPRGTEPPSESQPAAPHAPVPGKASPGAEPR